MKILLATQDTDSKGGSAIFLQRFARSLKAHQILTYPHPGEQPDWVIAQKFRDAHTLSLARKSARKSIYLMHDYSGLCISGSRTHHAPSTEVCTRLFSRACLVQFYPRRCGGLNPLTLLTDYNRNRSLLDEIGEFDHVGVNSLAMEKILHAHGISQTCRFHPGIEENFGQFSTLALNQPVRLLYVGRIAPEKGVSLLIESLARIREKDRFELRIVGAGTRPDYEQSLREKSRHLPIEWIPWKMDDISSEYEKAHFLLVPSLWPEPFGMVGVEAASHGTPSIAFDRGGISDWLKPGISGYFSEATADSLVETILNATRDSKNYEKLRRTTYEQSKQFRYPQCVSPLLELIEEGGAARRSAS